MHTWMWAFAGAAVAGVWLGPAWSGGPPAWAALGLLLPLLRGDTRPGFRVLAALLAGYGFAVLALGDALAQRLPADRSGDDFVLQGQVIGLPGLIRDEQGRRQRFQLAVEAGQTGLRRVSLTYFEPERLLLPGERIRLRARLYKPRARVNEAGFDRARRDLAAGVDARGYVRELIEQGGQASGVDAMRARLSERLRRFLVEWPVASRWLPALVTGDRRYLTDADWRLLRRTGTVHLMAISGLHITLVAGLVWSLVRWLPAPLWHPRSNLAAQQLAVLPALGAALGYACLAGFSLPTQRALVMTTMVFATLATGRRRSPGWRLGAALALVILWQPMAPLSAGFWLSFGAVALLVMVVSGGLAGLLRTQLLLGTGLGVVTAWLFGQWPGLAPLANLVMIPLFSFLIVPLALVAVLTGLPGPLAPLLGGLVAVVEAMLTGLVPFSPPLPAVAGPLAAFALVLMLVVLLAPGATLPRWVAPFLLLPALLLRDAGPAPGDFRLVVFDVGQGQAMAVRTRNAIVLYDLGPSWQGGNAGDQLIDRWLSRRRAPVALAFASHGDSDHAGGLAGLHGRIPAGRLLSGEGHRVDGARPCIRGQRWWLDAVRFEVLWPAPGEVVSNSNNRSCVVRVTGRHGSALLTGDIEKPVEYWLSRHGSVSSDLLQVPHHGSVSSSSYSLLRAVDPDRAFASVGHLNAFGHPAASVRRRYRELGVPLDTTAAAGMIVFHVDGQHNAAPERWRASRYRPWRAMLE